MIDGMEDPLKLEEDLEIENTPKPKRIHALAVAVFIIILITMMTVLLWLVQRQGFVTFG
jgi:hypothetical protein